MAQRCIRWHHSGTGGLVFWAFFKSKGTKSITDYKPTWCLINIIWCWAQTPQSLFPPLLWSSVWTLIALMHNLHPFFIFIHKCARHDWKEKTQQQIACENKKNNNAASGYLFLLVVCCLSVICHDTLFWCESASLFSLCGLRLLGNSTGGLWAFTWYH